MGPDIPNGYSTSIKMDGASRAECSMVNGLSQSEGELEDPPRKCSNEGYA